MKQIPLGGKNGQGKFALVDDEDYDWLMQYNWHCLKKDKYDVWYANRCCNRKAILMHREINKTPAGIKTDHRDGNGLNNQRYNLRDATTSQNAMNKRKDRGSSSQYKGVFLKKNHKIKKWCAKINMNKKDVHIGYFLNEIEAADAYNKKAIELFGEFAYLNILP